MYDASYQDELRGPRRRALSDQMDDGSAPQFGGPPPLPGPTASASPTQPLTPSAAPAPSSINLPAGAQTVAQSIAPPPTDTRSQLLALFQKYGLDPNNPGHGLANVDYFAGGGGGHANPGDTDYWTRRTEQEIRKALYGEQGDLLDTGSGGVDANALRAAALNDPVVQAQRQAILNILGQANQPIDVQNDATLGPAATAYKTARRQGAAEDRGALAERAAFQGLNSGGQGSGAFDSGVQSINEGASRDIAANQANLAQSELAARRQQLSQALSIADAIGARSESAQLQTALANLDAQMWMYGYQQQQGQYEDTQAFNYAQLLQQMNRDAILAGLGGQ